MFPLHRVPVFPWHSCSLFKLTAIVRVNTICWFPIVADCPKRPFWSAFLCTMHTHTHVYKHTNIHTNRHICVYTNAECANTQTNTLVYTQMHTHMCTNTQTYIKTNTFVYTQIHTHMERGGFYGAGLSGQYFCVRAWCILSNMYIFDVCHHLISFNWRPASCQTNSFRIQFRHIRFSMNCVWISVSFFCSPIDPGFILRWEEG